MRDDEAVAGGPHDGSGHSRGPVKQKKSFSFLDHDEYKDAKSPLIGKFLKDHIDRLEDEIVELKPFRDKYFDVRSKLEVVEERKSITRTAAAVSSVMLAVGGVGIGAAKDLWAVGSSGFIIGIASLVLIVSSFFIRVKSS